MVHCKLALGVIRYGYCLNGPAVPFHWRAGPRGKLMKSIPSRSSSPACAPRRIEFVAGVGSVMHAEDPAQRLRFGVFEADVRTGELTKHGKRLRLQEQPFQLLAMLLEKPGELVTREELSSRLWPQTIVDHDHGLNKAIGKIREALGDSSENPRFIETVARRGYRFLAAVVVVHDGQAGTEANDLARQENPGPVSVANAGKSSGRPTRAWKFFGLGLALVLAASLSWVLYPRSHALPAI